MVKLCFNCHYIGRSKRSFWSGNIYVGISFVALGIVGLYFRGETFGSHYLYSIIQTIVIISGILDITKYFIGGKTCPKCDEQAMHSLGTDESIKLIKLYDLNLGDNPPPSPENSA